MADTTNSTSARLTNGRPSTWGQAYAEYRHARAVSDALEPDDEGGDEAIETYCAAMDHLLENVRAPDGHALQVKRALAKERYEGGGWPYPEKLVDALIDDARRIGEAQASRPSLILALQARWEACWANHHTLNVFSIEVRDKEGPARIHAEDAEQRVLAEIKVLQTAILYQTPRTPEEAMILAGHISDAAESDPIQKDQREVLEEATATLFACLAADLDPGTGLFREWVKHSTRRRNYRNGEVG